MQFFLQEQNDLNYLFSPIAGKKIITVFKIE